MLKFIEQTSGVPLTGPDASKKTGWAIGADHAGYELKEQLKEHLQKLGLAVTDFGTHASESADYPDFAQAVAQSVASQKSQFGLLICATGWACAWPPTRFPACAPRWL